MVRVAFALLVVLGGACRDKVSPSAGSGSAVTPPTPAAGSGAAPPTGAPVPGTASAVTNDAGTATDDAGAASDEERRKALKRMQEEANKRIPSRYPTGRKPTPPTAEECVRNPLARGCEPQTK